MSLHIRREYTGVFFNYKVLLELLPKYLQSYVRTYSTQSSNHINHNHFMVLLQLKSLKLESCFQSLYLKKQELVNVFL